jgi:hypothetical protein
LRFQPFVVILKRKEKIMFRKLIFAALVAALMPAYSPITAPHPQSAVSETGYVARLNLTGGIAGVSLWVEVSSNGAFVVADKTKGRIVQGTLSAAELATLNSLIANIGAVKSLQPGESRCRDCFWYALEIQRGAERVSVQTDDIHLKDSGAGPLAGWLRALIFRTL